MEQKDVVIIGGGPAGLAAAVELHKQGIRNMIILEREAMLGGILRQCIQGFPDGVLSYLQPDGRPYEGRGG